MIAVMQDLWEYLSKDLFTHPGTNSDRPLFNPYSSANPAVELQESAQIRRNNLQSYFSSFNIPPRFLVVGEAPGWRGCRFSGIPFTSECQLVSQKLPFGGSPTSLSLRLYSEQSASIFWDTMRPYHPIFLVWNSLPLHPHQPGNPLSNRRASRKEFFELRSILSCTVDILHPESILAVGQSARSTLARLGLECCHVRHPAHGGAVKFKSGVQSFFSTMGIKPT